MSDDPMLPIPVAAAEEIARRFGYDQVVIVARRVGSAPEPHGEHVTTFGRDAAHKAVAARIGDFLKREIMGWTPEAPSLPPGFELLPIVATPAQLAAMQRAASCTMAVGGKVECDLLYAMAVCAFAAEMAAASPGSGAPRDDEAST